MPPTLEDRIRAVLPPHITIDASLAAGGQGTVFRGTCSGSLVAIKVFDAATDVRRIDRECDLLTTLSCPHVVGLIDHFEVDCPPDKFRILVYEYHSGGDLTALIAAGSPPVPEDQLIRIGREAGAGIMTLWGSRIVHRDIKPANIVRASDGRFLLVDLGLARHLDLSDLTAAGGAPGTRGFRSPEQAMGRRSLTINSDIYSLGMTLYVLASKRHPFSGSDIITRTAIDFSPMTASRNLSRDLINLISQMLEFSPARRPADFAARFTALGTP